MLGHDSLRSDAPYRRLTRPPGWKLDAFVIEQTAKVLIGTAFYVGIIWVAQRNPRAAGMMLTFPTLNGLVLLMAGQDAMENAASAMLLMPPINAAMWTFYFAGFGPLVDRRMSPAAASGILMGTGAAGWLVLVVMITSGQWGVPTGWQWGYAVAVLVSGALLTQSLLTQFLLTQAPHTQAPSREPVPPPSSAPAIPQSFRTLLARYRLRIAVFALTLAAIAMMDRLGASPALLGAVAGAPLVAMFGMQTIASDSATPLSARRAAFAIMAQGLWLGPGIAIVFVASYWRTLAALSTLLSGLAYHVAGAALLLAGWGLCILAIWRVSRLLQRQTRAAPAPRTS